jgi:hypothetical protein
MPSTRNRAAIIVSAISIALTAAVGMTACTADANVATGPDTSPSTSRIAETKYNECIDGAVQLWDEDTGSDETITSDDCDAANLISSDRTYDLGRIGTITVEASGTTVSVMAPAKIALTGDNNHITYTGDAPEIDDHGTGNTVTAG